MLGKPCNNIFFWLPLLLLGVITPLTPWFDLAISHYFFDGHFYANRLLDFVYDYAIIPAWVTIFISAIILIGSYWIHSWKTWQRDTTVLLLTLAIGSGVFVHLLLKDHWGRPRPKQIIEFGGHQLFRPYYEPNFFHQPESSKSFPCGHCTMGFFFFAVALLGRKRHSKTIYYTGLTLAWGLGLLLGVTRIAQGGHFFSDVVVSAVIMWYTAVGLICLIYPKEDLS